MSKNNTDILIVGGGIAGCIAAISLVGSHRVTLIDKRLEPIERIGESLAPAAKRVLSELDLLQELESQSPPIFRQNFAMQSYWGSDTVQVVDHMRNPDGYVKSLDRKAFEQFLRNSAESRGVECLWGTALQSSAFDETKQTWSVEVKSNEGEALQISANYIIDASGRQSHFARSIGVKREVVDKLIACWVTLPNAEENKMSTIASGPNGWWYSAVVPNGKRVVAFHTDSDLFDKSALKSVDSFLDFAQENEQMRKILQGREEEIEYQGITAANSTKLQVVAGKRWAAIGDAAVSLDPLSSQGMFNAMASAMQLKHLIAECSFKDEVARLYSQQMEQVWEQYLHHRSVFYGGETRWLSEFWRRRR
ncbi:MAG: NAD(P)/FAD-dependent oxidoreductase [Flavobacteriales bacterium]|nr:NAD(P)/FAD-dependent oxidoreductase [Flavobacteriales bacterium]